MDLLSIGAELLANKMGQNTDSNNLQGALKGLLGDGGDSVDLTQIVSKMSQNGGLTGAVQSWPGNCANDAMSVDQLTEVFGADKLSQFSNQLGVSEDSAKASLTDALPSLIDKFSRDGSLLDSVGGISGALNLAKKFL